MGNKIDREEEREVEDSSVQEFLAKHPKIKHLTTSAKNRQGVEEAFEKIALASIENKTEEMYYFWYKDSSLSKLIQKNWTIKSQRKRKDAADTMNSYIKS